MKWKKILLGGTVITSTLLVGTVLCVDGCYSRRVNSAVAAYHLAGEPITPEDFPKPSAADLSAGVELNKLGESASSTAAAAAPSNTNNQLLSSPRDMLSDGYTIGPEQLAAARQEIAQLMPDEKTLAAALDAPKVAWFNPPVNSFVLPNFSQLTPLRSLANALADDARLGIIDGDTAEHNARVLLRIRQLQQLAACAGGDGMLINQLVSTGLDALACNIVFQGPSTVTAAEARPLIVQLLDDVSRDKRVKRAMWAERACTLLTAQTSTFGMKPILMPIARIVIHREVPDLLAMVDLVSAGMREPDQTKRETFRRQYKAIATRNGALFTRIMQTSDRSMDTSARIRTERRIAACILALRAYRTEHAGQLPATLDDLVPRYLPAVPLDPYSKPAAPLHFDPTQQIIYSAGTNATDDRGNFTEPKKRLYPDPWSAPDFGVPLVPPTPTSRPAEEPG